MAGRRVVGRLAGAAAVAVVVAVVSGAGFVAAGTVAAVPMDPSLTAVSCVSADWCMAVGGDAAGVPIAELWNGRSWGYAVVPARGQVLNSVACVSASACLAVGDSGVADRWDGSAWELTRTPDRAALNSVSCASRTMCVAVGSVTYKRKTTKSTEPTGSIVWNGKSWAAAPVQRPGYVTSATLNAVSCAGPKRCLAVGWYPKTNPPYGEVSFAVSWNGKAWSLAGQPGGSSAVACVSAGWCMAWGGPEQMLRWDGTSWQSLSTPLWGLAAISCRSADYCLAVGPDNSGGPFITVGWNGKSWSTLAAPANQAVSYSLSCLGAGWCMAVGAGGPIGSVAQEWNGTAWTSLRTARQDELVAVSCSSSRNCVALGTYVTSRAVLTTLALAWNGQKWQLAARPPESVSIVSCTSITFCMAIGDHGAAVKWNGHAWSQAGPAVTDAAGLSCASAGFCMAIETNDGALSWNGRTWINQTASTQVPGDDITLGGVSCASRGFCNLLGSFMLSDCYDCNTCSGCDDTYPITEQWNGTTWDPDPYSLSGVAVSCPTASFCLELSNNYALTWSDGGWTQQNVTFPAQLTSVSCATVTSCMAIGSSVPSPGHAAVNYAEYWNGRSWRQLAAPWPGGGVAQVSCPRTNWCMVTGTASNRTKAAVWNGTKWAVAGTANP